MSGGKKRSTVAVPPDGSDLRGTLIKPDGRAGWPCRAMIHSGLATGLRLRRGPGRTLEADLQSQTITERLPLPRDLRKREVAQRSCLDTYGSEGRGFESLPARQTHETAERPEVVHPRPSSRCAHRSHGVLGEGPVPSVDHLGVGADDPVEDPACGGGEGGH